MKFIPFMIKFSAIFIFLDFYFLFKWRKFVKENNWNKWLYIAPFIFGIIMLFVTFENVWIQVADYVPSNFEKTLFTIKSLWYLPKALIVIPMIVFDLVKLVNNIVKGREFTSKRKVIKLLNYLSSGIRILSNGIERILKLQPALQTEPSLHQSEINSSFTESQYEKQHFENEIMEGKDIPTIKDRRKFLRNSTWAMAGIPFVIVGRGVLDTRYNFKIHEADIHLPKLDKALDGMRIIQISDIHAGSFHSAGPIEKVRTLINDQKADMIVLTGDFVNFNHDELNLAMNEFKALNADIGIYGCLGNHDHFMSVKSHEILKDKIRSTGIDLLVNESRTLTLNGKKINIAGNDNSGYGQQYGDFDKTLKNCDSEAPTVLLCHDPTNWDREIVGKRDVDLMLSGHTHGGQIGWEVFGDIISPARIAYKQFAGLYKKHEQMLYINRGLGTTGPPVRVGINPEVTILTLRSKQESIS
jgi:predicted MPP superfamily phosphohydrolase